MDNTGRLSQCMLENNDAHRSSRRGLRRKALTLSVVLECAILSALVLWPLLDPAILPKILNSAPAPPYHGSEIIAVVHASGSHAPSVPNSKTTISLLDRQPPRIPNHVSNEPVDDAPIVAGGTSGETGPGFTGSGPGSFIPGADGRGTAPEIKRPAESTVRRQVSEGVMDASLVHRVLPVYPAIARPMHLSGQVVLHAVIGVDGSVQQLQVVSGNGILAQAALAAVRQWHYRPTQLSGRPVEVETTITVNFVLEQN